MNHPPDLDDPSQQATGPDLEDLPGWAPLPPGPPGPDNPDPIPPGPDGATPGDGYASPGPGPSTPASTRKPVPAIVAKVTADGIGEAFTSVVRGIGETLNHLTAEDDADDVWIPTNGEAKGIGQPLGRIIARRVPDLPEGTGADLADGISAAIPAAMYLVRNLATWLPRFRKRRKPRDGAVRAPADLAAAAVTA